MADIKKIKISGTTYDIKDARVDDLDVTNAGNVSAADSSNKVTLKNIAQTDGKVSSITTNSAVVYNATGVDGLISEAISTAAADATSKDAQVLTDAKAYADGKVAGGMHFKGTLGTGGTATSLPTASTATVGDMYKVITAGTYASIAAKVGDVFICDSTPAWVLIPSGDEPNGTVTNIATGTGLTGGPITSTGTISIDETIVPTKTFLSSNYEAKFTDGSAAPATVNSTDGTISIRSVSQSSGKIGNGSAISGAVAYTTSKVDALVAAAQSAAETHAEQEDAKLTIASSGTHTHTVTGSVEVFKVNPTSKHLTATASGAAVTLGSDKTFIKSITPTTKYLATSTLSPVTSITVKDSGGATKQAYTASYDATNFCLDLTPVTINAGVTEITYANGTLNESGDATKGVLVGLGTPTTGTVSISNVTQPTITLADTAESGGVTFVSAVADKTATSSITSGTTSSDGGAHTHPITKQ